MSCRSAWCRSGARGGAGMRSGTLPSSRTHTGNDHQGLPLLQMQLRLPKAPRTPPLMAKALGRMVTGEACRFGKFARFLPSGKAKLSPVQRLHTRQRNRAAPGSTGSRSHDGTLPPHAGMLTIPQHEGPQETPGEPITALNGSMRPGQGLGEQHSGQSGFSRGRCSDHLTDILHGHALPLISGDLRAR